MTWIRIRELNKTLVRSISFYSSRGCGRGGGGRVGGEPIEAPDRERARVRQGGRAAQAGDQRVRYDGGVQGKDLLPSESIPIT